MLNVDINLLRTFLEIEKCRHFGKAAENLYLTQSAISARIKLLEDTLGFPLFERHRNNIQLTRQGKRLLPYATQMVELWVRTTQDISIPNDLDDFSIGAPESLWNSNLAKLPNMLFSNFNEMQLEIQSIDSSKVARRLMEKTLDLGFIYDQPKSDELVTNKAFNLNLALYSNRTKLTIADISPKNFVSIDLGVSFREIQAQVLPSIASPVFQATNWQMAIDYCIEFGGITLLPVALARKNKKLIELEDSPSISRDIYYCYHQGIEKQIKKQQFIEYIRALTSKSFGS